MDASSRAPRTSTFIVRDFGLKSIEPSLEELAAHPPDGHRVVVPGMEPGVPQGRIFEDRVRRHLEAADQVVVLTDLPNTNVGFELGFSLGLGKPTLLATVKRGLPDWVDRAPLFGGYFVVSAGGLTKLEEIVASPANDSEEMRWIEAEVVESSGAGTLFLCPDDDTGAVYHRVRERAELGWDVLSLKEVSWPEIPARLAAVKRILWTVAPVHDPEDERDGLQNTLAAVIAGYGYATGRELIVLLDRGAGVREPVDVKVGARAFHDLREYGRELERLAAPERPAPEPRGDVLATYRRYLDRHHAVVVPFFGSGGRALGEVYVELRIAALERRPSLERGEHALFARSHTLEELMALAPDDEADLTGHWVVLGEPGSGKTTACRQLCHALAAREDGPLPVLVSLGAWMRSEAAADPLLHAETTAGAELGADATGLATALRARAAEPGALWLLLDGLDELATAERRSLDERLPRLLAELPGARVLVTSRATDYHAPGESFREARLLPLDRGGQRELLSGWLDPDAARELDEELQRRPRLAELAPNPLMLTFLAKLHDEARANPERAEGLPRNRSELYRRSVRLLLERGVEKDPAGLSSPEAALRILPELSLALQRLGRDAWDRGELFDVLAEVLDARPALEPHLRRVGWTPETFLEDLRRRSGLLADHDGPGTPWRFLHRSLGEFLTAAALAEPGERPDFDVLEALGDEPQRWSESFGLLCGLLGREDPRRTALLDRLVGGDAELARRVLPQVEGVESGEGGALLQRVVDEKGRPAWDGDDLLALVRGLLLEGRPRGEIQEAVLADVSPALETEQLAWRYYAFEEAGISVDREAFFRACGRPVDRGVPELKMKRIPPTDEHAKRFVMGGPEEEGGNDAERPLHEVELTAFLLAETPVTEEQYADFDPKRAARRDDHPVVNVTWWAAWLFARWVGGRLPTEAEWEFACRGGTTGPWSCEERELEDHAWFDKNSRSDIGAVGKKKPNPFGLLDMHGNVWEWCADWFGEYPSRPQQDPRGPLDGSLRVLRGGSIWDSAAGLRSARRFRVGPGFRFNYYVGFRVARSAPRAGGESTLDP